MILSLSASDLFSNKREILWLMAVQINLMSPDLVTAGTDYSRGYVNPLSGKTVTQQPRSSLWRRSSLALCPVCRSQKMGSPHTAPQGWNILLLLYNTKNRVFTPCVLTQYWQMCDDWLLTCSVLQLTVGLTPEQIAMAADSQFIALKVMKPGSNSPFIQTNKQIK